MGYNLSCIFPILYFQDFLSVILPQRSKKEAEDLRHRGELRRKSVSLFAQVLTATILGMEVRPIQVEVDVSDGLPVFIMVGFASAQVKESQDRVRTALKNNGIALPPKRITVNFAPADIRKEGAGFDLPVAAALLTAAGVIPPAALEGILLIGELSLNGDVHPVPGVLPCVIRAREMGCRFCMIPKGNLREARLIRDINVIGVTSLCDVIQYLLDPDSYESGDEMPEENALSGQTVDFLEICGQEGAKRAAEIAVAGFHNLLFIGPPGAGKTMIARRIPTIMPALTFDESLELTKIYSIAGLLSEKHPLIRERPFRSPHHTSSPQSLTGGGRNPRPGEISLAHRGILFLDELPEFSRRALETLRQPMEDKIICLSRTAGTYIFPASFMLVAAMNPCPCGYYPDMNRCRCTSGEVSHYLGKLSQPLLDRIDLCADIPSVSFAEMSSGTGQVTSAEIRSRVEAGRELQRERFEGTGISCNGEMNNKAIEQYCILTQEGKRLLKAAYDKLQYSMRSYHRILRVARTIADLENCVQIGSAHLAEALSYRALDKKYWS